MKHNRIPPRLAREIYPKVLKLAMDGMGSVAIARQLSSVYRISLSPGTLRPWVVGDRRPGIGIWFRNVFKEEPSRALSYIIGANKGDGCTMTRSGMVKLEVTDRDFAQAFNANMAALFSRPTPNKVFVRRRPDRLPMYIVKYSCRQLVRFLRQPLQKILEFASAYPREFLRGFFDAEGHVDVCITKYLILRVGAENTNKKLLSKVRKLLMESRIPSRAYRKRRKGTIMTIRGKTFVKRRTSYEIDIGRLSGVKIFAKEIGFSIERKNKKLRDALSVIATHESQVRPSIWRSLYSKKGGEWIRRESAQIENQRVLSNAQEAFSQGLVV